MMTFKNEELVPVLQFLQTVTLRPKASRVRTKLAKLIQHKIDALYKDELELLEKYGKKDENGNLIQHDGSFSLLKETAEEYHQEKAILLEEKNSINVAEIKEHFPTLLEAFETSEMSVSGTEAEMLDLIMDELEKETEELK
ncbi:Protein of unknown function [Pilibacter termitis]|uniref:DUF1617 family protein n=1 Tax=Pilibacter termitis TaxID=263852 RepID=A0A1T4R746_9ENTE|nr:DUF1617 family protein [Pilibacter termitis]SKA11646.1 Protein of unknown function [Pilibacter termitis]